MLGISQNSHPAPYKQFEPRERAAAREG